MMSHTPNSWLWIVSGVVFLLAWLSIGGYFADRYAEKAEEVNAAILAPVVALWIVIGGGVVAAMLMAVQ